MRLLKALKSNSMFGWPKALRLLNNGQKVARSAWAPGHYITAAPSSPFITLRGPTYGKRWNPYLVDFSANDWGLYEP